MVAQAADSVGREAHAGCGPASLTIQDPRDHGIRVVSGQAAQELDGFLVRANGRGARMRQRELDLPDQATLPAERQSGPCFLSADTDEDLIEEGPQQLLAVSVRRGRRRPDALEVLAEMGKLENRIGDRRLLRTIRRYLGAGMMADGVAMERHEGTPQGGPRSPLLANVLLDDVDKELERRGHAFVRYADDCNVYVRSRRAGERVMEALRGFYARLRLRVNEDKSAVARVWGRKFLGYSFWVANGRQVKLRVAPKSRESFKQRVRQITSRNGGRSLERVCEELGRYLRRGRQYFTLADTPRIFQALDPWIHRRLRMLQLKQWKRGTTVYRELRRRGVGGQPLGMAARFARSWWHVAAHKALHFALPGEYFDSLGVVRLA